MWSRQESNLDLELRKLLYYPLYDGTIFFTGLQRSTSFSKLMNITAENFDCNCQQYYTEKFSYHGHTIWSQK